MKILLTSALLLAGLLLTPVAWAANGSGTSVQAVLIMASNNKSPADPRLAPYEAELQRNFPESSFRLAGEGSTKVTGNTPAKIELGQGHRVEFDSEKREADGIHLKVRWLKGQINGAFVLQSGIPLALGRRPAGDGEVPIVLVIAK